EGGSNRFAHLPFTADAGKENRRAGKHEKSQQGIARDEDRGLRHGFHGSWPSPARHKHGSSGLWAANDAWHGPCYGLGGQWMSRITRVGKVILAVIVIALALIGLLTVTRGTPVGAVVTLSRRDPPGVQDSLFERTFELFTGAHVFSGNVVEQALNGD